jgi:hypothetical protein
MNKMIRASKNHPTIHFIKQILIFIQKFIYFYKLVYLVVESTYEQLVDDHHLLLIILL